MAQKLETKQSAPSAVSTLEIKSSGDASSIVLTTEEHKAFINVNGKDEYQVDKLKRKQICTFIGADGIACTLDGVILDIDCVEISAAYKVVAQVMIANELKQAFAAGKVSKGYMSLELVKVVEVWDTPKNCLWRAKDGAPGAVTKPGAVSMDDSGKLVRPAA